MNDRTLPNLLIVEDDQSVAFALSMYLEGLNFTCLWAASAAEAKEVAADAASEMLPLRAALVDLNLPDERGTVAIEQIRNYYPGLDVLVMSAFEDHACENWRRQRQIEILHKPIELKALDRWLKNCA